MAKDLIARYIWVVDTLSKYGKLTREEIDNLWKKSSLSEGKSLPKRTFFYYRRAIETNFQIDIACNELGQYYIENQSEEGESAYTNLLLDSFAVNSMLRENQKISDLIQVESIPSAREFLSQVISAVRDSHRIEFSYAGFNRARVEEGILFHPYLLKLYKQRWYMIGQRVEEKKIRTYALDRVKKLLILNDTFVPVDIASVKDEFRHILGITSSKANVRIVKLRAERTQAKYLRALPLHPTQQEEIHDDFSIFTYKLKLNYELVHEILSMGASVEVLAPAELKVMIIEELKNSLAQYE